jgi:hypothetical protein
VHQRRDFHWTRQIGDVPAVVVLPMRLASMKSIRETAWRTRSERGCQ